MVEAARDMRADASAPVSLSSSLSSFDAGVDAARLPASLAALSPTQVSDTADAHATVAEITAASGTSFGPGMRALSAPRRRAMWALYAFARVIDDIADEPMDDLLRAHLLDAWRREVEALYAGSPASAIGRALAPAVAAYALPKDEFHALIDGMAMDAAEAIVAPDLETLRLYTRRVAGTVGMLSMRIFGAWRGAVSARFALALADALQLTNILRDVAEDAERGRLYLPHEILERHGASTDPARIVGDPALPPVCRDVARLARTEFDTARAALPGHARSAIVPALMMMGVYEATLNRIEYRGFRPTPRVRLSKGHKVRAALTAALWPRAFRQGAL
ncbi:MAG: squalene/phytoene synthase family protein [Pseudomonadota bacterium]